MATDAEFMTGNVNIKKHIFKVMEIFSKNKPGSSLRSRAEDIIKTYLYDPDVNRIRPKDGITLAPIHFAVLLEDLELLGLFKKSKMVNVNVLYLTDLQQGTILDLAVVTRNIKLEVIQSVLEMCKLKAYDLPGPGMFLALVNDKVTPLVIEEAVKQDREEVLFLLLSCCSPFPHLDHYTAALSCIVNNNLKIFIKLLAEIQKQGRLYLPPSNLKRCCHCKGPDPSLLHLSICSLKPRFLHSLLAAGHEARAVRTSTGLTPLQDALRCIKHRTAGPTQGSCNDGKCVQILGELLSDPSQDLLEESAAGEQWKMGLEEAMMGDMCYQARRLLEKEVKKLSLRKKLETRRKIEEKKVKASSDSETSCWHCSASSEALQLSQCASCRTAWYCGKSCQREDWEKHWQWCEGRTEERRNDKEQKKRVKEQKKPKPYPNESLAFELD